MGGLFSSDPKPSRPSHVYSSYPQNSAQVPTRPSANYSSQNSTESTYRDINYARRLRDFESLNIGGASRPRPSVLVTPQRPRRTQPPPEKSKINPHIFNLIYDPDYSETSVVKYICLQTYDHEYLEIQRMISNKKNFKIDSIEKVVNPYLEAAYKLKREEKKLLFSNIEERLLFHGTKRANVDEICKMNFNWRLCKAHKYGKGVSFSPNTTYASNYSDENVYNKVMLVAKVLIARSCIGNEFMVLPDSDCDTSQKGLDGIVIVKFEDHEFCPVYKINYHLVDENVGKGFRGNRRGRRGYQNLGGKKRSPNQPNFDFYNDLIY